MSLTSRALTSRRCASIATERSAASRSLKGAWGNTRRRGKPPSAISRSTLPTQTGGFARCRRSSKRRASARRSSPARRSPPLRRSSAGLRNVSSLGRDMRACTPQPVRGTAAPAAAAPVFGSLWLGERGQEGPVYVIRPLPAAALVVPADDRLQVPGEFDVREELDPPDGVHLHDLELVARQRAGLAQDLVRHAHLSQVVEIRAEPDRRLGVLVHPERLRHGDAATCHALAMAEGVAIARLDRLPPLAHHR